MTAASAAPKGLLTLAALKRALALTAGGSTAVAAALSFQRPVYVLPPEALAALADQPPCTALQLLPRGCQLALVFAPLVLLSPLASLIPSARRLWYRLLTWTLGHAGCAFIKWGQWAAVRPDLFSPDMARLPQIPFSCRFMLCVLMRLPPRPGCFRSSAVCCAGAAARARAAPRVGGDGA